MLEKNLPMPRRFCCPMSGLGSERDDLRRSHFSTREISSKLFPEFTGVMSIGSPVFIDER